MPVCLPGCVSACGRVKSQFNLFGFNLTKSLQTVVTTQQERFKAFCRLSLSPLSVSFIHPL